MRQALGLPLSDSCLSETKESLPTMKDQLRRVGGDSVDDVSTVGAPCRGLAHNWLWPGGRGRMGCAHSQSKQKSWVTQLDGGPGRVKGAGQSVLVVSFERHRGPQVSACLCWPALVLLKLCLLEKSSIRLGQSRHTGQKRGSKLVSLHEPQGRKRRGHRLALHHLCYGLTEPLVQVLIANGLTSKSKIIWRFGNPHK